MKKSCLITMLFMFCVAGLFSFSAKIDNIFITAPDRDSTYAKKFIEGLSDDILIFQQKIGLYPNLTVNIRIAEDEEEFEEFADSRLKIVEFSEGFFAGEEKVIYLRNPRNLKNQSRIPIILLHEYIHLFINNYFYDAPLWFHEGMAVYFSEAISLDRYYDYVVNLAFGNAKQLIYMQKNYPKNQISLNTFYVKSALAVHYLFSKKKENFYYLWDNAGRNPHFARHFNVSFGKDIKTFSEEFEVYENERNKFMFVFAVSSLLGGVLPLFLFIGYVRKKYKNRKLMNTWEEEKVSEDF